MFMTIRFYVIFSWLWDFTCFFTIMASGFYLIFMALGFHLILIFIAIRILLDFLFMTLGFYLIYIVMALGFNLTLTCCRCCWWYCSAGWYRIWKMWHFCWILRTLKLILSYFCNKIKIFQYYFREYHDLRPPGFCCAFSVGFCCVFWADLSFLAIAGEISSSSNNSSSKDFPASAPKAPLLICCKIRSRSAWINCCWRTWRRNVM